MKHTGSEKYNPAEIAVIDSLISHSESALSDATVENLHDVFNQSVEDFIAIVDRDDVFRGIVSRRDHQALLSGRYGFSLFRDESILDHLVDKPVVFRVGMSLQDAAAEIFSNDDVPDLQTDAVIVDRHNKYIGIVPAKDLIYYQWKLSREQAKQISQQENAILRKNRTIFEKQDELRLKEGQFAIIFENDIVGVALLDPTGRIEECNQAFRKMAAISGEGSLPCFFDLLVEEQKTPVKNLLANLSRDKSSIRLETLFQAGGDNLREVHGVVSLVRESGQLAVQIEDVTNRRKMERRMANDEKNILLDTLVGGVAHEINNKLTPIIGFASLHMQADDTSSEEEIRSSFQLIRDCATEASSIISQLLQLSKPPASQMVVSDIRQIVEDTVSLLRFQAREAGCRLLFDPPAFEVPVKSDIAQLKQVLVNVVINAIHASRDEPSPEVKLDVAVENDEIVVSVIDQGSGISPENLERIFDPFFTTKGPQKGNGLGLSVCSSIMAMHSGSIEVVSEVGLGTTMRLVLPVSLPEQNPFRAQPEVTAPGNDFRSGSARNILIVDDEPWLGKMIQKGLKSELGLDTVAVLDGRKAIEKIEDDDFDLIISDVRMPNMDGFKLFEWVCKNRPELSRRFLFITGDAGGKVFNQRLSDLDAPVLRKPFDLRALSYQCNEMLSGGRGSDSVALMN